jgi:L-fuculose-phosphate aldolase
VKSIQEQLVQYYRWLRQYGLNDSHSGNGSVRDGQRLWLTPSGACADTLQPSELVECAMEGPAPAPATRDSALHQAVYRKNSHARAVLHSHCPHAVALTFSEADYIPPDLEGQLYFPRVPVIEIPYEDYFAKSPVLVAELLTEYPVAIVRGHGVFAWGESLEQAYKWSCSLELSAKTAYLARQAGTLRSE